ncbi:hypothetical protein [Actinomadura litoris]|uniref:hypothetical protein n=1 Tax=Actinomadura litoris TaxID=2678616 RepID=UPI001FA74182|nr:hypothetical protein [Actinomadura litoris]
MDTWAATVRLSITGPAAPTAPTDAPQPLPQGITLDHCDPRQGRARMRVAVRALDVASAVSAAVEEVADAVSIWPGVITVVGVDVLRADEAAHLTAHPEPIDLVDDTGAGKLLGVTRQRVVALAGTPSLDFPCAVAPLTRGHVYTAASIRAFGDRWTRTTGRPRKVR